MIYNINELIKSLEKRYNTINFDYMSSFKELVIYFLSYILNIKPIDLKLKSKIKLTRLDLYKLNKYINKAIVKNIPIEYIVGFTYIYNEKFLVNSSVLIPRQDTETLITAAIEEININKYNSLLDICTGSGVVGISISKNSKINNITLMDISSKALKIVNKNCILNNVSNYVVKKSDLFTNIEKDMTYDIITANPPYLSIKEMDELPKNVEHEPKISLFGGEDGLDFYRKIASEAYKYLNNNGCLIMEIGYKNATDVIKIINDLGIYKDIQLLQDINKKDRVIKCHFQKK